MNIEESKRLLDWVILNKLYIDTHNECDYHNIHKAIETLLTAYEKEKEKNKELSNSYDKLAKECNEENRRCMLLAVENQDLKEKNKELVEQNKDMKLLFNIQASIAKELDFNTNEKMVKFKDEYYVPDTMAINANIGEPKTIELRYISATKYLTKFDGEE